LTAPLWSLPGARGLEAKGKKALPIPASQIIDWEKKLGHLSHRQVGVHLGLGFYGRNNLLVHPEYGSQLRLVTVLTDWEIDLPGPVKGQELSCGGLPGKSDSYFSGRF